MKKLLIYLIGTMVYYLLTVLVLKLMTIILDKTLENIWMVAIPVTLAAELLLVLAWCWKQLKMEKNK